MALLLWSQPKYVQVLLVWYCEGILLLGHLAKIDTFFHEFLSFHQLLEDHKDDSLSRGNAHLSSEKAEADNHATDDVSNHTEADNHAVSYIENFC